VYSYTLNNSVPESIDQVFTKTSPKRSFSVIQNERFGLVFAKTGSIFLGTGVPLWLKQNKSNDDNTLTDTEKYFLVGHDGSEFRPSRLTSGTGELNILHIQLHIRIIRKDLVLRRLMLGEIKDFGPQLGCAVNIYSIIIALWLMLLISFWEFYF
jgi:hypothetical protein